MSVIDSTYIYVSPSNWANQCVQACRKKKTSTTTDSKKEENDFSDFVVLKMTLKGVGLLFFRFLVLKMTLKGVIFYFSDFVVLKMTLKGVGPVLLTWE